MSRPARVDFAAQREKIAGRRADLLYALEEAHTNLATAVLDDPAAVDDLAAGIVRIEAELAALDAAEPVLDRREAEAEAAEQAAVRARIETKLDETLAKLTTASGQVADHVDKLAESVAAAEGLEADAAALAKSLRQTMSVPAVKNALTVALMAAGCVAPDQARPIPRKGWEAAAQAALRAPRTTRPRPGRAPFMAGEMPGTAHVRPRDAAQPRKTLAGLGKGDDAGQTREEAGKRSLVAVGADD